MSCELRDDYASKVDNFVDTLVDWTGDKVEKGLDLSIKPLAKSVGVKMGEDSNWFKISEQQRKANEVINSFRTLKANIYDEASAIMEGLDTLSKEDNVDLIKALNGDAKPSDINPTLLPLYRRFRKIIDINAQKLVDAGILKDDDKIEHYLKRYYKAYVEDGVNKGGSLAYKKLQKRKDLTYDERIALGMIEDATFVISNTIAEQNILLQKAKVLQSLADKFGVDEAKEGYTKVSDESAKSGLKRYGALAGKYIPNEVKAEMDYVRLVDQELGFLENVVYPIIDHLKVNLTVKNPATHVYNIASNILLSGLNGDFLAVGKVLHMRAKNPEGFKSLVKTANKYGLNSYLDDFEKGDVVLTPDGKSTNVVSTIWKNLYMAKGTKAGDVTRNLYDWEDKIFKVAAFKKLLDKGVPEAEAYKQAVEVYVDYTTPLPAAVRVLDKSGVMPFLHYQYKSTPAVLKVMGKHIPRTILMATGAASLGITAFQNDDKEDKIPKWAKDKLNLLGIAEWVGFGNGWYLNAGRMIPGTKFEFEFGGIVDGIKSIVADGETPLGYKLYRKKEDDPDYSALEKYGLRALAMAENYFPSMTLGRYAQRGAQITLAEHGLAKPRKNYYDEDMTATELAGRALGVRKFNEEKELKKNTKKKTKKNKKKNKELSDFDKDIKKALEK